MMKRIFTSLVMGTVALTIAAPVFAFDPGMTTNTTTGDVGVQFNSQNPGTQPSGDTQGSPPTTQPSGDTQGQPSGEFPGALPGMQPPVNETGPESQPPSTGTDAGASASFSLGAYFNEAQLSLLSPEEQEKLKAKLSGLTGKQFDSTVKRFDDWMDDTLDDMKKKDRMNRQDQKFEKKLDKEFAKLMEDKMKRERELRAKKVEAAKARNFNRPRPFMGQVASVDAAGNAIVLKKFGAQSKILVTTKTVLVVTEEDGARVGTLADFQAGDRIQGLVRRSKENHTLIGVVVIKLGEKGGEDDDMSEMPVPMQ